MATTTNFSWETPDDSDLVKDGASAIRTLGSAIDASMVDLKGGTTGQILSKASDTDMDFSWAAAPSTDTLIPKSIIDAAGDLIIGSAADTPARLAIGTNGQVLTSNGTTAAWATPSSGGAFTLIETKNLASQTSVTFTDIPQTYNELRIEIDDPAGTSALIGLRIGEDGIFTGNYYEGTYRTPVATSISALSTSTGWTGVSYPAPCVWRIPFYTAPAYAGNGTFVVEGWQTSTLMWGRVNNVTNGSGYATKINQLQVYIASGTFSAGTVKLYGVK